MKIITFSVVRNESDILEAFVRHHAAFVHRMVIVDHRSQDNSREILEALRAEGLPLDVRSISDFSYDQAKIYSDIVREVVQRDAPDWMLPLDADEFLIAPGAQNVQDALGQEGDTGTLIIPWRGYIPLPSDDEREQHVLRRITHRRTREDPQWWKIALPRSVLHEAQRLIVGTHYIHYTSGEALPTKRSRTLALAHFPIRSATQITCKAIAGWLSTRPVYWKCGAVNYHWKVIYDRLVRHALLTKEDLKELGLTYASTQQWHTLSPDFSGGGELQNTFPTPPPLVIEKSKEDLIADPVPTEGILRYPVSKLDPWQVLLVSARDLAEEYGKLAATSRG